MKPWQKNCPNSRLLMPQRKKRPPTSSRWKTQTRQSQIPTAGALFQNGKTYFHSGVDLEAAAGSHILAVADGTVVESGYNEAYGYMVILEHAGGVQTFYAHMTDYLVLTGDTVQQGQIIGTVGSTGWSTGPHLHLGVMIDGESVDPLAALQSEA